MSKILMLDLEGVLIATARPPSKHLIRNDYGIRSYAHQFINESLELFDQIYLNTCVSEKNALRIMQDIFNISEIKYFNWDRGSPLGKTSDYAKFSNDILIHVEDESPQNKEAQYCIKLGHTYLSIKGWYPYHAWLPEYEEFRKTDTELLITLEKIKKLLI
jgi:hypothetical protein